MPASSSRLPYKDCMYRYVDVDVSKTREGANYRFTNGGTLYKSGRCVGRGICWALVINIVGRAGGGDVVAVVVVVGVPKCGPPGYTHRRYRYPCLVRGSQWNGSR